MMLRVCHGAVDAIVVVDRHNLILSMNPAAERLRAIKLKMAEGKPVSEVFALLDAVSRDPITLPTVSAFHKDRSPRLLRHAVLLKGGAREVVVNCVLWPTLTDDDELIGYAALFVNIQDTVTSERHILDQQKVEAIGSMAGSMANDFTVWLNAIAGHAAAAIENLSPNTRAHEAALRILETTRQAGSMINRLHGVASAANTHAVASPEFTHLSKVVPDAVSLARATFMRRNVICKTANPEAMPAVMAEPAKLLTCLLNLLRNAVEAMPEGGTVAIDTAERVVSGRRYAVLRVRDSGRGISRAELPRLFEPFFSMKPTVDGSVGLGLTVVQSLVEKWGGFIKVRSHLGHGTSFRVFLPLAEKNSETEPVRQKQTTKGRTVLITDDSETIRREMDDLLRSAGYTVLLASSASECLQLYQQNITRIDAAIIDAFMPGDDVDQLLKNVVKMDPNASIILTSGFSRDYVRDLVEYGAWQFHQKPLDPNSLLASIRRLLEQADERNPNIKPDPT